MQIAKLPDCRDTLPLKGDNAISNMLQANGSFEWCPFDSHTQFWSQGEIGLRRRILMLVVARL